MTKHNRIVFDIEGSDVDYKKEDYKIWCICTYNIDTKDTLEFYGDKLADGVEYLKSSTMLIGHYIDKYDIPALEKYFNTKIYVSTYDTCSLSVVLHPEWTSYSLADLGKITGESKIDYVSLMKEKGIDQPFAQFYPEMFEYCKQDVKATYVLFKYLTKSFDLELESEIAAILTEQIKHGVYFDLDKARLLYSQLQQEKDAITTELQKIFPPKLKGKKLIHFNPGSTDQVAQGLITKYNWKPEALTPTGKPKVDKEILPSLPYPEAQQVHQYNQIEKIMSYIDKKDSGWITHATADHRIHGRVSGLGAITHRMTHFDPNLGQVPSKRKLKGKECRELFCAPEGKVFVGCDVKGLEARVWAHYMYPYDFGELIKLVEAGDIHNRTATGLYGTDFTSEQRDVGKVVLFAKIFGAWPTRLAKIMSTTVDEGKRVFEALNDTYPNLMRLEKAVIEVTLKNRVVKVIDGTYVPVDFKINKKTGEEYPDAPLSRLIQTTGAILCKRSWVIANHEFKRRQLSTKFILNVHDEVQIECDEHDAEEVAEILKSSVTKAGEYYNFRCKLEAECKIGKNWSETH